MFLGKAKSSNLKKKLINLDLIFWLMFMIEFSKFQFPFIMENLRLVNSSVIANHFYDFMAVIQRFPGTCGAV